jgi:capsular polysaccharide biosynthesis protein
MACALRVAEIIKDLAIMEQDETKGIYNPIYKSIGLPSTMSCVDTPRFVGSSVRYSPILSAAIGAFAGALIAVFALFFYSAIDDRVRNRKTLEKNFEIPILGVIPKVTFDAAPKNASAMKSWRSKG